MSTIKYFSFNKRHNEFMSNVLYYKSGEIFFGKNDIKNELYSLPEYSDDIKSKIDELCLTLVDDEWYDYKLIEDIIHNV